MSYENVRGSLQPAPPDHPDTPTSPLNAWRHALRLAAASEQYVAQLRAQLGLSSNEMNALLLLDDGGACTMTELSRRIRLSRPALTKLVDRLEHDGWLRRMADPHDRRRVIVATTERFEDAFVGCSNPWRQRLQNLASASGETSWSIVLEHLDEIYRICARSALDLRTEQ